MPHPTPTGRIETETGHSYFINGQTVMGVTTILSEGIPKPALMPWSAKVAAEWCYDNQKRLATLDRVTATILAKNAPNETRDEAARRGTQIHDYCEAINLGKDLPPIPDELEGPIVAYQRFLQEKKVEILLAEKVVLSHKHLYAGTFDLIARIDNKTVLCDIKTSRGIWPETALQLAAYQNADTYLDEQDQEQPLPPIDATAIIHLQTTQYRYHPINTTPQTFQTFLHAQQIAQWRNGQAKNIIGKHT